MTTPQLNSSNPFYNPDLAGMNIEMDFGPRSIGASPRVNQEWAIEDLRTIPVEERPAAVEIIRTCPNSARRLIGLTAISEAARLDVSVPGRAWSGITIHD